MKGRMVIEYSDTCKRIDYQFEEAFGYDKSLSYLLWITLPRGKDLDITQSKLADYLNIKQNTYSQYENESRQIPIDSLIKLAKYFNVSIDYILGITDTKEPFPGK